LLFDKSIEERETQAAESWPAARCKPRSTQELWQILRFSHHHLFGSG